MGRPMAANVLAAGFDVRVHHRSPDRVSELLDAGAQWAASGAELGAACDVLVIMLPDLPDLEPMLWGVDGIAAGARDSLVLFICSTSSASAIVALQARLERERPGVFSVLDAPVSGGEDGAKAGTLSLFIGGDAAALERARGALEAMGTVHHLGPLGSGSIAKYCNQLIVASAVYALGEASVIAERSGLDLTALFDSFSGGYANSRVLETRGPRMLAQDYSPSGAARYMVKDLTLASDEAARTGVDSRQLEFLLASFRDLVARGLGDKDIAATRAYVELISASA